ncbi:MAG: hypothetical protein COB04_09155 [Gammaproteobacteria bacterium]|nr:MAG: hypothetical protein COB04_09155 [Gammaproteobacteria bacterium]
MLWLTSPFCSATETVTLSTGYHFIQGDYNRPSEASTYYLPVSINWRHFPWQLKLTVPYIKVRAENNLALAEVESTPSSTDAVAFDRSTDSGLGDVVSQLSYSYNWWVTDQKALYLDYSAKVKWATAESGEGLGTGSNDYTIRINAAQVWRQWQYFAHLGYQYRSQSDQIRVKNGVNGSIGLSYVLSPRRSAGLVFDLAQAQSESTQNSSEATLFASWKLTSHWKISAYTLFGFSSGSPDIGLGGQISYRFLRPA